MPRGRRSSSSNGNASETPKDHNGEAKLLDIFVKDIERHESQIESYKGEHMKRCKDVRDMISEVYDAAAKSGFSKKALKAVIKRRAYGRKMDNLREDLAEDNLEETFDSMCATLGMLADLPLGQAALSGKEPKEDPLSGLDSQDEFDRVGAENAAKIEAGITPLPN